MHTGMSDGATCRRLVVSPVWLDRGGTYDEVDASLLDGIVELLVRLGLSVLHAPCHRA
jgi:hypothetical protein